MSEHTIHGAPGQGGQDDHYSHKFWDKELAVSRKIYLRILLGGSFAVVIAIFAVFSIFWGALWKSPVGNLSGWVVDFDGGVVGKSVVQGLTAGSSLSRVTFTSRPASEFSGGIAQVMNSVVEHHTWVAVVVNPGASDRLLASYANPNSSYRGLEAITVYGNEARNENAFRSLIRPSVQAVLDITSQRFALQSVPGLLSSANVTHILSTSPQTILAPISYTVDNIVPFDHPVASAATFVGLIYVLILSFFVVMIGNAAREVSGMSKKLTLRSLIVTRFVSTFTAYFFLSLFYSLLSLAFQLDFTRKFGHGGFVIFWMLNWVGMLSVGLALEAMVTLLTVRFIPFFLIIWIIVNVSVCILPIEVLPIFFRYGYAVPFYNINRAVRTIVFGTKNQLGQNFGILIAWAVISCISIPLIQWFVRRNEVIASRNQREQERTLQEKISSEGLVQTPTSTSQMKRETRDEQP